MRVLTVLVAAALMGAAGCGSEGPPAPDAAVRDDAASAHAAHGAAPEVGALEPAGGTSLYVLPGTWIDQAGRSLTLNDLAGRPRVVVMAYTYCAYACPALVARMKQIEAAFEGRAASARPGFVLVSIDPERDTPGRLTEFAESMQLDAEDWVLLNGPDDQVRALSVLLGVAYRATGTGDFAHSNVLTVLDAAGAIQHRTEGLGGGVDAAVDALERVLPHR